jgi:WD40 repeat protein/energy-coupling factor transporter ATP-binding protein EcfA2
MAPDNNTSQKTNPFPGLRPFSPEENIFFFGRDNESREIHEKLFKNRFVAVTGASGSGKSSLIQCGLLSEIRGNSQKEDSEWRIITFRPGSNPLRNLAIACRGILSDSEKKEAGVDKPLSLNENYPGIISGVLKSLSDREDKKVLIVVDQFEELFRKAVTEEGSGAGSEREVFIDLLTGLITNPDSLIYIVIAMRSDLISECSQFKDFTRLINGSNYLLPQMGRANYRETIEGPLKVAGISYEPELVESILDDLGNRPDQLPVLQHALMRIFSLWKQLDQPDRPISISDYNSAGTLMNIMSRHADELYNRLDHQEKKICEKLFKSITGKGPDNKGVRKPAMISALMPVIRCSRESLIKVIDNFRDSSGSFINLQYNEPYGDDIIVDLTHESLISLWRRLAEWVDEEADSIKMYLHLSELSAMFQQGRTGLLKNPDLQLALKWKDQNQPTVAWAKRYEPAFERAMVYLRTSEKAFLEAEEARSNLQKARMRRIRIFSRILGSLALVTALFMIIAFAQKSTAENRRIIAEQQREEASEQRAIAEKYAVVVLNKAIEADSTASVALQNEKEALMVKEISEKRRIEAERQTTDAERDAEEARVQKIRADEMKAETQRLRMISIAKSMSLRSLQNNGQRDLQSLLAYQSWLFNKRNNGHYNDADVYQGLYNLAKQYGNSSLKTFTGHSGEIRSLAFVPGKREFFTSGSDGRIIKWDLDRKEQDLQIIYSDSDIIDVLAVNRDADWLACGGAGSVIRMIPLRDNVTGYELKGHSGKVSSLIFSYDGNYLYSAALDGKVLKWDLSARTSVDVETGEISVTSIELSTDDRLIAGLTGGGSVLVWNPDEASGKFTIGSKDRKISSLQFKPGEDILAVGYSDGIIELWDISAREKVSTITAHSSDISTIRFNKLLSQMASSGSDGTLKMWDTDDLSNPPVVFDDNEGLIVALEFSTDGQVLLSGTLGRVNNLISRPTLADQLASEVCTALTRNFSSDEWLAWVGRDIVYETTCPEAEYRIKVNRLR